MVEIDWGALVAAVVGLITAFGAMVRYVQKRAVVGDKALLDLAETQGQVALLQEQNQNRGIVVDRLEERIVNLEHELAAERLRGLEFKREFEKANRRIHELEVDKATIQSANAVLERFLAMFSENFGRVIEAVMVPGQVQKLVESDGAG